MDEQALRIGTLVLSAVMLLPLLGFFHEPPPAEPLFNETCVMECADGRCGLLDCPNMEIGNDVQSFKAS